MNTRTRTCTLSPPEGDEEQSPGILELRETPEVSVQALACVEEKLRPGEGKVAQARRGRAGPGFRFLRSQFSAVGLLCGRRHGRRGRCSSVLPPPTYPGVIFPLSTVQETEAPGETPLFQAAEQGQISHLLGPQSYSVL